METGLFLCLDHEDLLSLVMSKEPQPDKLIVYLQKGYGFMYGKFFPEFKWNYEVLDKMDDDDLYHLYVCLKYDKDL